MVHEYMSIEVKFFASLREALGMASIVLDVPAGIQVTEIWHLATKNADLPANTLCAINMEYARLEDVVHDGDEIAFFPPVTGG